MTSVFRTIGLFSRQVDIHTAPFLKALYEYLASQSEITVYLTDTIAKSLSLTNQIHIVSPEQIAKQCDLLISIGGDGSLLKAARLAVEHNTAVLGVNRGRLGFLADIRPQDFKFQLSAILKGEYQEESRFFLEIKIHDARSLLAEEIALNEVTFVSGDIAHMMEYQLSMDQQFMCAQRSDGLIISTPTGSTAYALSGGGPIVHPKLNAFVIVPMFSHSLNVRPIVLNADATLALQVTYQRGLHLPSLSCDGRPRIPFPLQAIIRIRKKEKSLRLIHPLNYQYFDALRGKLQWHTD